MGAARVVKIRYCSLESKDDAVGVTKTLSNKHYYILNGLYCICTVFVCYQYTYQQSFTSFFVFVFKSFFWVNIFLKLNWLFFWLA